MKSAHILLVEDNDGDILLTTEALQERTFIRKISIVKNGKEAIDFLFQRGKHEGESTPDLILLDVNLPLKNGHEVLKVIKQDERTKRIPVIMLTTSSSVRDIDLSYQNHANCYITKPVEMDEYTHTVRSIEDFWLQLVKLPTKEAS